MPLRCFVEKLVRRRCSLSLSWTYLQAKSAGRGEETKGLSAAREFLTAPPPLERAAGRVPPLLSSRPENVRYKLNEHLDTNRRPLRPHHVSEGSKITLQSPGAGEGSLCVRACFLFSLSEKKLVPSSLGGRPGLIFFRFGSGGPARPWGGTSPRSRGKL